MKVVILVAGICLGVVLDQVVMWIRPLGQCVTIPGEKGRNGGGDAGDGIFCRNGFFVAPGKPGTPERSRL